MGGTELEQIFDSIDEINNDLLRLIQIFRNPAPHARFLKAHSTDTTYFIKNDIDHVRNKFPAAELWLITRLGKALSRRRQFFKYRELHQTKLSHGLSEENDDNDQQTIASSLRSKLPSQGMSISTYSALDEDSLSETGFSQTSSATSTAGSTRCRIPSLSVKYMDGKPFPCPFCHTIIVVTSRYSWKKHVIHDVYPYVCTFNGCLTAERPFARRHEWAAHELNHMRLLVCCFGCTEEFTHEESLRQHMLQLHTQLNESSKWLGLVNMLGPVPDLDKIFTCPLCRENVGSWNTYTRHLGRHQQDLAVFVLPNLPYEFEDTEDTLNKSDEEASEAFGASIDEASSSSSLESEPEPQPSELEVTQADSHVNDKHSSVPKMYHREYKPCRYSSARESNYIRHMEKGHGWGTRVLNHGLSMSAIARKENEKKETRRSEVAMLRAVQGYSSQRTEKARRIFWPVLNAPVRIPPEATDKRPSSEEMASLEEEPKAPGD
ncbi:hypothetical protein EJ08DRAFT_28988 [Tothia fuscella]|uniref:C2H2-type domain-containing protein n=1 Tax=Tothia fuscella TaxID=1048955 RepID=A0A9P4NG75_9PEZI|nr:hypothetical protein EJ08DRAFT_28988 [Tothia fuscella]